MSYLLQIHIKYDLCSFYIGKYDGYIYYKK